MNLFQCKRGDWRRQWQKLNLTLNKQWNWSNCTKLALSAIWTHAQSVRVSERNSVVVSSNIPLRLTLSSYFKEFFSGEYHIYIYYIYYIYILYIPYILYIYISIYLYIYISIYLYLYLYIFICLSIFIYLSIYLSILYIYIAISIYLYIFICLSIYLYIRKCLVFT